MRGTLCSVMSLSLCFGIIPAYAGNTNSTSHTLGTSGDHPRVCGEHHNCSILCSALLGSSPRMRGTQHCPSVRRATVWIIPAYAGNTCATIGRMTKWWDHPRVCGEHLNAVAGGNADTGSSPRMRGTLGFSATNANDAGIIPAYAGNTLVYVSRESVVRDHPRVCGEHAPTGTQAQTPTGSSPRMRGTLLRPLLKSRVVGIIPAYAGNTSCKPLNQNTLPGSSPRMRGTLSSSSLRPRSTGIIPAYAGNTQLIVLGKWNRRDHPRVCGEHFVVVRRGIQIKGSSPRMRGTRSGWRRRFVRLGIIPAYAGNTCLPPDEWPHARDHPRVCGEHYSMKKKEQVLSGSSPRMRGTPLRTYPRTHEPGIIPAYAGNTPCSR